MFVANRDCYDWATEKGVELPAIEAQSARSYPVDIKSVHHPETRRHSRISFGMVIALAIVAVFAWGYTQKHLRERRQEAEYRVKDATARRGNPVLSVPEGLSVESLGELQAIRKCATGLDGPDYSMCFGQGSLLGIPGYLTVEWTSTHRLHSLSYDFQLPSVKVLLPRLVEQYGPPHRFDGLSNSSEALGLCWPLPEGQSIVMEKSTDDKDPGLSVTIESQVAANLHQLLEAVSMPCSAQPGVSPAAFSAEQ